MKFECEKTLLASAIDGVSRAITNRAAIPVLEGIYMKAEAGDTFESRAGNQRNGKSLSGFWSKRSYIIWFKSKGNCEGTKRH